MTDTSEQEFITAFDATTGDLVKMTGEDLAVFLVRVGQVVDSIAMSSVLVDSADDTAKEYSKRDLTVAYSTGCSDTLSVVLTGALPQ